MNGPVLVDTGPLVALLSASDSHHEICRNTLGALRSPLYTCWPVLTEAAYLLRDYPDAVRKLLGSFDGGFLRLLPLGPGDIPPISSLLDRYHDQSFQLADAALMYLAEREEIFEVFTLDRRDFSVYRTQSGRSLTILPDFAG